MSFGRIKTRLRALINRKDFTAELAGDFILDAISEIERDLRIGPMEVLLPKDDWDGTKNAFPVPMNYLEGIRFFTDAGTLKHVDLDTFLSDNVQGSHPRIVTRVADRWLIKPTPQAGSTVYLHYYGETFRPVDDVDRTIWTEAGFIACLYSAAALAGDFYQMEADTIDRYETKATAALEKLAGQELSEQWSGRQVVSTPKDIGEF